MVIYRVVWTQILFLFIVPLDQSSLKNTMRYKNWEDWFLKKFISAYVFKGAKFFCNLVRKISTQKWFEWRKKLEHLVSNCCRLAKRFTHVLFEIKKNMKVRVFCICFFRFRIKIDLFILIMYFKVYHKHTFGHTYFTNNGAEQK